MKKKPNFRIENGPEKGARSSSIGEPHQFCQKLSFPMRRIRIPNPSRNIDKLFSFIYI